VKDLSLKIPALLTKTSILPNDLIATSIILSPYSTESVEGTTLVLNSLARLSHIPTI